MGKFICKALLFFAIVAIIDLISDYGFKYLKAHAQSGDTQKNYYISEQSCDDILILGSSRAARHYIPSVLEDSLGLSCYNCGELGCGIITAYARYKMVEERHKPKLVIYEVTPKYDYYKTDEYSKYLGRIRQYSNKPVVRKMFLELGNKFESMRLVSNMYKNNSFIVHNVMDFLLKPNEDNYKGFEPLYGVLKDNEQIKEDEESNEVVMDSVKLSYLEKLILETKKDGVQFCFIASPQYIDSTRALKLKTEYEPIINLCDRYRLQFIDYTYKKGISDNREFFQDSDHMNYKGAQLFTAAICSELSEIINNCSSGL